MSIRVHQWWLGERWGSLVCGLLLAAGTLAVYWPVTGSEFVNLDDPIFVTENPRVQSGITREGLKWALTATEGSNWHPVTWVSHMLDCQWHGLRAGGHHLTSLLLHAANSGLLFALLLRLTGRRGASFAVAALFAWHPLHVESVAWIAERKDVLSAFFFMLTLWAYATYAKSKVQSLKSKVQSPKSKVRSPQSGSGSQHPASSIQHPATRYYLLSLGFFALGLMSKPMVVTLPFVLLLLDYWPLGRIAEWGGRREESGKGAFGRGLGLRLRLGLGAGEGLGRLLLEKVPFILLSAIVCGVTLWAQNADRTVIRLETLPMAPRLANAVLSYYGYLGKTVWPAHLAVFYPYGQPHLTWVVWLAGAGLAVMTAAALCLRQRPYLAVGWLWYAGMLVPVIGLVQVGAQALADRYMYLPSIGLFIAAAFGLGELAARFRHGKAAVAVLAGLALAGCLVATRRQVWCWRNSETLFRHAVAVTRDNYTADTILGSVLQGQGRVPEAIACYRQALAAAPVFAVAHCSLASAYAVLKQRREAVAEYETALKLNPNLAQAHYALANELLAEGDAGGAVEHFRAALALKPDYAEAHYQLAAVLGARGEIEAASGHYREVIRLKPDWSAALNNLAWSLATQPEARFRNGKEAVELAARAVALTHTNDPGMLDTLAGALAEAGRFSEAVKTAQTAEGLAHTLGAGQLERQIQAHLRGYERGQPFREP